MAQEKRRTVHTSNHGAEQDLKTRILESAERLFKESGYESVSARAIAEVAGCSQMAMYRHFPDKESLLRHLCTELYERFTTRVTAKYGTISDPKERLRNALRDFVLLALKNPHHYRLIFLTDERERPSRVREDVAVEALSYFRDVLRQCFRKDTPDALIEERMAHMIAVLHGITIMLLTRPGRYRLTKESALAQLDSAFELLLAH